MLAFLAACEMGGEVPATPFSRHLGLAIRAVNIQDSRGKAKAYQVRQVLLAIDKLKEK